MRFYFSIEVEAERVEGKFASREDLEGEILEALESANPSEVEGPDGGRYEITDWVAEADPEALELFEQAAKKARRERRKQRAVVKRGDES